MEVCKKDDVHIKQEFIPLENESSAVYQEDQTDSSIKLEDDVVMETVQNGEVIFTQIDKSIHEKFSHEKMIEHKEASISNKTRFHPVQKEYKKAKLYCRKCGGSFDFKCDLFNHMFLHIDIIMAEAEYIRSTRKAGSEAICKEDEEKRSRENDCKNDNVEEHLEQNQSTEFISTGGTIKLETQEDFEEGSGGFESDDSIQAEYSSKNSKEREKILATSKPDVKAKKAVDKMLKMKARGKKKKSKKTKKNVASDKHETHRRKKGEDPQVYECNDCSYKSTELWAMRKHCVIHLPNNPFKCSVCDFSCKTRYSLKSHFTKHTGEMPYKCEHCGRCFRARSVWARHVATHNDKNHTCHICAKKFYRSDSLRYHLLTHSEQRPYKCHICPYGAKHPKTLKLHLEGHDGVKRFDCSFCDFKTSKRNTLAKHQQIHNSDAQYKCDKCTFTCRSHTTFKKHCDVHNTSARVFSCSECDFKSTMERAVMRHLRQHQNIPLKMLQMKVKALNHNVLPYV